MRRTWSIGVRTAIVFALTSMAVTGSTVALVNLGSQASLGSVVTDVADSSDGDGAHRYQVERPRLRPDPRSSARVPGAAERSGDVELPVLTVVATLQWQWSVLGIGAAGVLSGGVGWVVSRRMLAPIDRITAAATRISASTLHERIGLDGPDDELRRLSRTVDDLLDRLESAFESQRRFVAQASHELRTPLAVQRAAVQIGLHEDATADEVACAKTELLEQNRRTEHLVESLLVLAEAERGLDGRQGPVDLGQVVDDVVDELRRTGARADVTVRCRRDPAPPGSTCAGPVVTAEPVLLRQLVRNLIDNAVEYSAPDGVVDVVLRVDLLRVTNPGAVLAPDVVATLREPFRRAVAEPRAGSVPADCEATGRRHSGLGLSIVEAVAVAHGWRVDPAPRPGGGLVVDVHLSPM
ncbi:sensor histidine kinase [Curtobacterium aetherium]|uniref:HAMP domain-containing histidine kinase n=1 Tax=Curtobacterium aetherium TaxID=2841594 RepID=A0ACD1E1P8_9MICO|nr:HAMP domain-containing sensor histidine kinase [Curtobacterium sp. L6-1]QWS32794.1 HAMP domain-containing histidine kinase [Curtobacterium sp. L6-1]